MSVTATGPDLAAIYSRSRKRKRNIVKSGIYDKAMTIVGLMTFIAAALMFTS
jgi:hypothetical protein